MKTVPSQPSRYQWHLSLVKELALPFLMKKAFMESIDWTSTFAIHSLKIWDRQQENSQKIAQFDCF